METVDELVEQLKDYPDPDSYSDLMIRLEDCGAAAVPALIELLKDHYHRWAAARVLGQMGAISKPAVPALIAMTEGLDCGERMHAAQALGALGAVADEAIPALRRLLLDPHEADFVREAAEYALREIDPDATAGKRASMRVDKDATDRPAPNAPSPTSATRRQEP
jgi:PBS lyase HEAT-like repeat